MSDEDKKKEAEKSIDDLKKSSKILVDEVLQNQIAQFRLSVLNDVMTLEVVKQRLKR
jgi:hypothetical protein